MRISIATKLLLSFFLILALSFLPAYWYLRRDLMARMLQAVESDLGQHVQLVANRLSSVPDPELDRAARDIASILVDRVSVIALNGRVVGESAVPAGVMPQLENHLDREEVQQALQHGYGSAVRQSPTKGEPYLYVARLLRSPEGSTRGIVRLSRPLGVITQSFQGAVTFLYRAAGVAASLVLILSLGATLYTVRPLLRIRQAALAYARGEYNYPLPEPSRDEIGDLGESMAELARRIQQERVEHSADAALRGELVRVLPVPVLLLRPDGSPQDLNAPFREAAEIDPAHEGERVDRLCHLPEMEAAMEQGRSTFQPQPVTVHPPWRRGPLRLLLCPLPAPRGEVGWALLGEARELEDRASRLLLVQRAEVLLQQTGPARSPDEAARLCELRVLLGALCPGGPPAPEDVTGVELPPLIARLLAEMRPAAAALGARIALEEDPPAAVVADAEGRIERTLRAALWRSLGALHGGRGGLRMGEAALELVFFSERTVVLVQIAGLQQAVPWRDLDQALSPLGGGAGPSRQAAAGEPLAGEAPEGASSERELWLQLRRA